MQVGKIAKAWVAGVAALLVANVAWIVALHYHVNSIVISLVILLAPLFASLLTSYMAPHKKILLGVSMVFPTALFGTAITAFYGDASDFPSKHGLETFFLVSVVYNSILTVLGSCLGYYLVHSKKSAGGPGPSDGSLPR